MQPRQLTVQAPVDEQAADLSHEAAEQLPVGDCLEHHVLAAQGATQAAVGCVGPHRGLLVRATLGGAVRSVALP